MPNPAHQTPHLQPSVAPDPLLWLEEIDGPEAQAWVTNRNRETESTLGATPRFSELRNAILDVLDSDDRIPMGSQAGDHIYNFWRDAAHPRGIWRRTLKSEYLTSASPEWEVLLDLDALNTQEDEDWVWHGAQLLRPELERALIHLSHGGSDADVTREFDLATRDWVSPDAGPSSAFTRPEAKGSLRWINRDVALLSTDIGPDSMTTSGYPRTVQIWRRGTPMPQADTIFTAPPDHMGVFAGYDRTPGFERIIITDYLTFFTSQTFLAEPDGSAVQQLEVPDSAEVSVHRDWLTVELREDWEVAGAHYPAGSLLVTGLSAFVAGQRDFYAAFTPDEHTALSGYTWTRHHLVLNILRDVVSELEVYRIPDAAGDWLAVVLPALGETVTISGCAAVDPIENDELWITTSGFTLPTTLHHVNLTGGATQVRALPHMFDAQGIEVQQYFAASDDGTQVPYFVVRDSTASGPQPTLLYAYGGFEVSLTPGYSAGMGRAWLNRGGTYVLANIRGGGEYGPRWHQAALQEKRHRAYEDLAAVARDLTKRGITTPGQLGVKGGSNGGLLTGNMYAQYPQLFGAVVVQVPLLDMRRYSRLLAGASWMAEYGDPDDPAQWEFIRTFSPYHLVDDSRDHPPVLITTSTRDDRVHPGHARKFGQLLRELGRDVTYWENTEGGHGGAADNSQAAYMEALAYEFLWHTLS